MRCFVLNRTTELLSFYCAHGLACGEQRFTGAVGGDLAEREATLVWVGLDLRRLR